MRLPLVRKFIAVLTLVVYSSTSVLLASLAESHVWEARRRAMSAATAGQKEKARQFASLPAGSPLLAMPQFQPPILTAVAQSRSHPRLSPALHELSESISLPHARLTQIHDAGTLTPPILILQDVHLNAEAQSNLAHTLVALAERGKLGALGVEGAFSKFDFSLHRQLPAAEIIPRAELFLNENRIAAHTFVGITLSVEPPLVLGIDDMDAYESNLQAVLDGNAVRKTVQSRLTAAGEDMHRQKEQIYSRELKEIDRVKSAYDAGLIGIASYLDALARHADTDMAVQQFLEAYRLENKLDLQQVNLERERVLETLTRVLDENEVSSLLELSLAHRAGQIGFASFYDRLKRLCEKHAVSLRQSPAFDDYVRYVLLADGVKGDDLFKALHRMEKQAFSSLARSREQRDLIARSRHLALTQKLIDVSLTPEEWTHYREVSYRSEDLRPFESFYEHADVRSQKMAANLLSLTRESGNKPVAVITGGFHTADIARMLRDQKRSFIVATPVLTKLDRASATSYLSIFAREKTPLEKLFAGEKLFISPAAVAAVDAVEVNTTGTAPNVGHQLAKSQATRMALSGGSFLDIALHSIRTKIIGSLMLVMAVGPLSAQAHAGELSVVLGFVETVPSGWLFLAAGGLAIIFLLRRRSAHEAESAPIEIMKPAVTQAVAPVPAPAKPVRLPFRPENIETAEAAVDYWLSELSRSGRTLASVTPDDIRELARNWLNEAKSENFDIYEPDFIGRVISLAMEQVLKDTVDQAKRNLLTNSPDFRKLRSEDLRFAVYLVGSFARGDGTAASDVDFVVFPAEKATQEMGQFASFLKANILHFLKKRGFEAAPNEFFDKTLPEIRKSVELLNPGKLSWIMDMRAIDGDAQTVQEVEHLRSDFFSGASGAVTNEFSVAREIIGRDVRSFFDTHAEPSKITVVKDLMRLIQFTVYVERIRHNLPHVANVFDTLDHLKGRGWSLSEAETIKSAYGDLLAILYGDPSSKANRSYVEYFFREFKPILDRRLQGLPDPQRDEQGQPIVSTAYDTPGGTLFWLRRAVLAVIPIPVPIYNAIVGPVLENGLLALVVYGVTGGVFLTPFHLFITWMAFYLAHGTNFIGRPFGAGSQSRDAALLSFISSPIIAAASFLALASPWSWTGVGIHVAVNLIFVVAARLASKPHVAVNSTAPPVSAVANPPSVQLLPSVGAFSAHFRDWVKNQPRREEIIKLVRVVRHNQTRYANNNYSFGELFEKLTDAEIEDYFAMGTNHLLGLRRHMAMYKKYRARGAVFAKQIERAPPLILMNTMITTLLTIHGFGDVNYVTGKNREAILEANAALNQYVAEALAVVGGGPDSSKILNEARERTERPLDGTLRSVDVNGTSNPFKVRESVRELIRQRNGRNPEYFDHAASQTPLIEIRNLGDSSLQYRAVVEAVSAALNVSMGYLAPAEARVQLEEPGLTLMIANGYHRFESVPASSMIGEDRLSPEVASFFNTYPVLLTWYCDSDFLQDAIRHLGGKSDTPEPLTKLVVAYLTNAYLFETADTLNGLKSSLDRLTNTYKFSKAFKVGRVKIFNGKTGSWYYDEERPIAMLDLRQADFTVLDHRAVLANGMKTWDISHFIADVRAQIQMNPIAKRDVFIYPYAFRELDGRLFLVTVRDGRPELNYSSLTYSKVVGQFQLERHEGSLGLIENGKFVTRRYLKPKPEHAHEWPTRASLKVSELIQDGLIRVVPYSRESAAAIEKLQVDMGLAVGPTGMLIANTPEGLSYDHPDQLRIDAHRYKDFFNVAYYITHGDQGWAEKIDAAMNMVWPDYLAPQVAPVRLQMPVPEVLPQSKPVVLYLEDTPLVQMLGIAVLKKLGYDVLPVVNGDEGLAKLAELAANQKSVDFIVSDVDMPGGMDGKTFWREVKEKYSDLIPKFVFLASHENRDLREDLGQDVVSVGKPFNPEQLGKALAQLAEPGRGSAGLSLPEWVRWLATWKSSREGDRAVNSDDIRWAQSNLNKWWVRSIIVPLIEIPMLPIMALGLAYVMPVGAAVIVGGLFVALVHGSPFSRWVLLFPNSDDWRSILNQSHRAFWLRAGGAALISLLVFLPGEFSVFYSLAAHGLYNFIFVNEQLSLVSKFENEKWKRVVDRDEDFKMVVRAASGGNVFALDKQGRTVPVNLSLIDNIRDLLIRSSEDVLSRSFSSDPAVIQRFTDLLKTYFTDAEIRRLSPGQIENFDAYQLLVTLRRFYSVAARPLAQHLHPPFAGLLKSIYASPSSESFILRVLESLPVTGVPWELLKSDPLVDDLLIRREGAAVVALMAQVVKSNPGTFLARLKSVSNRFHIDWRPILHEFMRDDPSWGVQETSSLGRRLEFDLPFILEADRDITEITQPLFNYAGAVVARILSLDRYPRVSVGRVLSVTQDAITVSMTIDGVKRMGRIHIMKGNDAPNRVIQNLQTVASKKISRAPASLDLQPIQLISGAVDVIETVPVSLGMPLELVADTIKSHTEQDRLDVVREFISLQAEIRRAGLINLRVGMIDNYQVDGDGKLHLMNLRYLVSDASMPDFAEEKNNEEFLSAIVRLLAGRAFDIRSDRSDVTRGVAARFSSMAMRNEAQSLLTFIFDARGMPDQVLQLGSEMADRSHRVVARSAFVREMDAAARYLSGTLDDIRRLLIPWYTAPVGGVPMVTNQDLFNDLRKPYEENTTSAVGQRIFKEVILPLDRVMASIRKLEPSHGQPTVAASGQLYDLARAQDSLRIIHLGLTATAKGHAPDFILALSAALAGDAVIRHQDFMLRILVEREPWLAMRSKPFQISTLTERLKLAVPDFQWVVVPERHNRALTLPIWAHIFGEPVMTRWWMRILMVPALELALFPGLPMFLDIFIPAWSAVLMGAVVFVGAHGKQALSIAAVRGGVSAAVLSVAFLPTISSWVHPLVSVFILHATFNAFDWLKDAYVAAGAPARPRPGVNHDGPSSRPASSRPVSIHGKKGIPMGPVKAGRMSGVLADAIKKHSGDPRELRRALLGILAVPAQSLGLGSAAPSEGSVPSGLEIAGALRAEFHRQMGEGTLTRAEYRALIPIVALVLAHLDPTASTLDFDGPMPLLAENNIGKPLELTCFLSPNPKLHTAQILEMVRPYVTDGRIRDGVKIKFIGNGVSVTGERTLRIEFGAGVLSDISFIKGGHDNVLALLADKKHTPNPAEVNSSELTRRFFIPVDVDLPANYFDLSSLPEGQAREDFARSLHVYLVLSSLRAVEVGQSLLPNWDAIRAALIAA